MFTRWNKKIAVVAFAFLELVSNGAVAEDVYAPWTLPVTHTRVLNAAFCQKYDQVNKWDGDEWGQKSFLPYAGTRRGRQEWFRRCYPDEYVVVYGSDDPDAAIVHQETGPFWPPCSPPFKYRYGCQSTRTYPVWGRLVGTDSQGNPLFDNPEDWHAPVAPPDSPQDCAIKEGYVFVGICGAFHWDAG
jgi:hypothetical protein